MIFWKVRGLCVMTSSVALMSLSASLGDFADVSLFSVVITMVVFLKEK